MKDNHFYSPFGKDLISDADDISIYTEDDIESWLECKDVEFEDVKLFQQKFGMLVHDRPVNLTSRKLFERADFIQEELNEFTDAICDYDVPKMADALVDLVYVIKGTAVSMGLPWRKLWNSVQQANMEKISGIGPRGIKVDCIKPEGWKPPDIASTLREAGWDENQDEKEFIDDGNINNI